MNYLPSGGLTHATLLQRNSTGFSSGFEDAYADPNRSQFENMPQDQGIPESPSMNRDHKLLGFSMPSYGFTLLDDSLRSTSLNMVAQLHGMFFLAESQWPAASDAPPPPPELTCYRRNLFQITGSVTLPRSLRYIMTDHGDRIPIFGYELSISATESVENNAVKIISVPWKTPTGGATASAEDKIEKEPPSIPLETVTGQDMDADYATFPIQWKRLQFRIATANNGRRKELQQHFVIRLRIVATLSTGDRIPIAESHSGAIIVRGRSPRNFQSRKDFPLGNSGSSSRKHLQSGNLKQESNSITSAPKIQSPPEIKSEVLLQQQLSQIPSGTPDISDWQNMLPVPTAQAEAMTMPDYSSAMVAPLITPYTQQSTPDQLQSIPIAFPTMTSAPVDLSFGSGDEGSPIPQSSRPRSRPPTSNPSPSLATTNKPRASTLTNIPSPTQYNDATPQRPRFGSQQPSSTIMPPFSQTPQSTPSPMLHPPYPTHPTPPLSNLPSSHADLMGGRYEYFPLEHNEYTPPVDGNWQPQWTYQTAAYNQAQMRTAEMLQGQHLMPEQHQNYKRFKSEDS